MSSGGGRTRGRNASKARYKAFRRRGAYADQDSTNWEVVGGRGGAEEKGSSLMQGEDIRHLFYL